MKDKKFYVTIATIIILSIWAWFTVHTDGNSTASIDPTLLAIQDTTTLTRVVVTKGGQPVATLNKSAGKWMINDKYPIDNSRQTILMMVLTKVKAKRPVSEKQEKEIITKITKEGYSVKVFSGNDLIKEYQVSSDVNDNTGSIYVVNGHAYYADVLGLEDFIAGQFFAIDENAWRSRTLFSASIKNLELLQIDFLKKPRVTTTIQYKSGFFDVPGVQHLDSNRLGNFLIQYRLVKADQLLSPQDTMAQSYMKAGADFAIKVEQVDSLSNNEVSFYYNRRNPGFLIGYSKKHGCPFKINKTQVSKLLAMPQDFEKQKPQDLR